jgi:hypothetical protein
LLTGRLLLALVGRQLGRDQQLADIAIEVGAVATIVG